MATVPTSIIGSARGVVRQLAGFVVYNENIKESPVSEQVPDQNGSIADEIVYDHKYELSLSVASASSASDAPAHSGDLISYAGHSWKLDSCEEAGSYNQIRKWNIAAHRYDNYPVQA